MELKTEIFTYIRRNALSNKTSNTFSYFKMTRIKYGLGKIEFNFDNKRNSKSKFYCFV